MFILMIITVILLRFSKHCMTLYHIVSKVTLDHAFSKGSDVSPKGGEYWFLGSETKLTLFM